jgi:hypothetical protein
VIIKSCGVARLWSYLIRDHRCLISPRSDHICNLLIRSMKVIYLNYWKLHMLSCLLGKTCVMIALAAFAYSHLSLMR